MDTIGNAHRVSKVHTSLQGMHWEFESVGAVSSITRKELWASKPEGANITKIIKSASAKGDVPKIYWFVHQELYSF